MTALLVLPLVAQEPGPQVDDPIDNSADSATDRGAVDVPASGAAQLFIGPRSVGGIGYSVRNGTIRFSLMPIAQALGVGAETGPLGEGVTLTFEDRQVRLGAEQPILVTTGLDGSLLDTDTSLRFAPVQGSQGLLVSVDILERLFGDSKGMVFDWDPGRLQLRVVRRQLRELVGGVSVRHHSGISTVQISFSQRPRYRLEQKPGALEIRLVGDSLELTERPFGVRDPLVADVVVSPTAIRLELAPGAAAAEPYFAPGGSMVIDVYRRPDAQVDDGRSLGADGDDDGLTPDVPPAAFDTIVLDPGHGGDETGAIGSNGTIEKELTLRVARLLRERLSRRLGRRVQVILTREDDVAVAHDARVALANQNEADLFISIHFNSYFGSKARGAETYFLSREASDQRAAQAVDHESAYTSGGAGEQELADLQLILWDLAQSHHLAESQRFANLVQEELNVTLGLRDRGVRQAPFRVLMGANMPAVLVELGFLSNSEEEAKLQQASYLGELVESLVRAVVRWKRQLDTGSPSSDPAVAGPDGETR